ncbi:MAG: peptidylprolyl isomerase [Steroidobacteraceae bacterium]
MTQHIVHRFAALAGAILLATAAHAADAPRVRVTTSLGSFVIELNPERAPLTVANFLRYVKEGHYTNTLFHRVIANFVIQGGGVTPEYTLKPAHDPIPNESGNGLQNLRGAVGLARAASPHSGDAQFYVNVGNNADLDPLPTRWGYAVFGQVIEGMDVVDRISVQPTGAVATLKSDAPLTPVVIRSIELIGGTPREETLPAVPTPAPAAKPAPAPAAPTEPPPTGQ